MFSEKHTEVLKRELTLCQDSFKTTPAFKKYI